MTTNRAEDLISLGDSRYISAEDVLFLRQNIFKDGIVDRAELKAVFALGRRAPDGDPSWREFFEEVCADFFLNQETPPGYITDAEFSLIRDIVLTDGGAVSLLETAVLVRLLEKAIAIPDEMSEFVSEQLHDLVSAKPDGACIWQAEAELIRRFLYAAGGDNATGISRAEAEFLFDLHDLTATAENHPAWSDLFIKAIAAHVMQHVGYRPLPREEALRLHDWVVDQSVDPSGFFARMFSGGLSAIREAYGGRTHASRRNDDNDIARAIAEQVTLREADWLADRIARDGSVHDMERALIAYMKELDAELPPKLQALVLSAA